MSSSARRQARVEAVQQARAAERRRERRVRIVAAVAVVALVLGGTALLYLLNRPDPQAARPAGSARVGDGVAVGPAGGVPVVDVYEDFQCPICAQLEATAGDVLPALAREGRIRLVYHPMSFLGPESDRAANAFGCAAEAGRPVEYHDVLFANQPPEQTGGFTNPDLIRFGALAGISGEAFASCVNAGTFTGWADQVDAAAQQRGVRATPTIVVNGRELQGQPGVPGGFTEAALRDAVTAAG